MLLIPNEVFNRYVAHLKKCRVADASHADYKKWLRYFLDFCDKYPVPDAKSDRVRLFCEKLRDKGQAEKNRQQAAHAISLYFEMQKYDTPPANKMGMGSTHFDKEHPHIEVNVGDPESAVHSGAPSQPESIPHVNPTGPSALVRTSYYSQAGYQEKSDSPEWDALLEKLAAEIKVRHYSRKTLQTYAQWSRKFQRFLKNKPPEDLSTADVKEYLTFLAVTCNVAASTQNQAFNSLLFLFRHPLKREFGELRGVPRAKKSLYIPMVLSRQEIDAILNHLYYPHNLAVNLLFGCGLRLFECLQLRVRDFNFDAGILTVHGKGKKDRTVPIPGSITQELKAQMEIIARLHDRDLTAGYDGVFLDDAIESKYPNAPKEFIHQWFLPQQSLTVVVETGERRRYHLHESDLQKALYNAVRKAKIPKKVTAHTFSPPTCCKPTTTSASYRPCWATPA